MSLTDLAAIVVIGLAVYLPKAVPLLVLSDRMPTGVRRWLDFVAPAVLAALVAPAILVSDRMLMTPRLEHFAFLATFIVAVLSRRVLPSIACGVVVLVAVLALGPNG